MAEESAFQSELANIQKHFWRQLFEMQSQPQKQQSEKSDVWTELDQWWRMAAPGATNLTQYYMDKIVKHGNALFELAENCSRSEKESEADPIKSQTAFFEALRQRLGQAGSSQEPLSNLMAFCELPFDTWQRAGALLAPFQTILKEGLPTDSEALVQRLIEQSGFGVAQGEMLQFQRLMDSMSSYQEALTDYNQFFSDLAVACATEMEQTLAHLEKEGVSITSAKELYSAWVDVCERCYSERVMGSDYAVLQGRLINSTMAVRQQMQTVVDEKLAVLQMPTSGEIKSLQRQANASRQEIKTLKAEIELLKTAVEKGTASVTKKPTSSPKNCRKNDRGSRVSKA